jgi:hypothetical protein
MGTNFDVIVLGQFPREDFLVGTDKMELVPADSNEIK